MWKMLLNSRVISYLVLVRAEILKYSNFTIKFCSTGIRKFIAHYKSRIKIEGCREAK